MVVLLSVGAWAGNVYAQRGTEWLPRDALPFLELQRPGSWVSHEDLPDPSLFGLPPAPAHVLLACEDPVVHQSGYRRQFDRHGHLVQLDTAHRDGRPRHRLVIERDAVGRVTRWEEWGHPGNAPAPLERGRTAVYARDADERVERIDLAHGDGVPEPYLTLTWERDRLQQMARTTGSKHWGYRGADGVVLVTAWEDGVAADLDVFEPDVPIVPKLRPGSVPSCRDPVGEFLARAEGVGWRQLATGQARLGPVDRAVLSVVEVEELERLRGAPEVPLAVAAVGALKPAWGPAWLAELAAQPEVEADCVFPRTEVVLSALRAVGDPTRDLAPQLRALRGVAAGLADECTDADHAAFVVGATTDLSPTAAELAEVRRKVGAGPLPGGLVVPGGANTSAEGVAFALAALPPEQVMGATAPDLHEQSPNLPTAAELISDHGEALAVLAAHRELAIPRLVALGTPSALMTLALLRAKEGVEPILDAIHSTDRSYWGGGGCEFDRSPHAVAALEVLTGLPLADAYPRSPERLRRLQAVARQPHTMVDAERAGWGFSICGEQDLARRLLRALGD